ncbi:hypothetical protein CUJ83_14980 [Methanocella sp. CWC-04]|uniref:Uncharacterized protein n=1 Tax=Methanooceanicella nereidis TaxID=2052831 RepID=A0AAP2RHF2_9EURY|nr:hypothetical protein [Methanocella sp. CWC-04]MCD1296305.1 hypothetical protein [Methanocella sp. CWC-04]
MKRYFAIMILIMAAIMMTGCASPEVSPTPAPTITPAPTSVPSPTLIGGSDEAHVAFYYNLRSTPYYAGLEAQPGKKLYLLDVSISSDKPVQASAEWFRIDYRRNATDDIVPYYPITYEFDATEMGPDTGVVTGRFIFELPDPTSSEFTMQPVYDPPEPENQVGPYKVYDEVYGVKGLM